MMKTKNAGSFLPSSKNAALKKFVVQYAYSLVIIHLLFFITFWHCSIKLMFIMHGIGLISHVLLLIYFSNYSFAIIKLFINLYLIFISIFVTILVALLWKINPIIFAWYLLFPLGILNIFPYRTVIYWNVYIFMLALLAFAIPFSNFYPIKLNGNDAHYIIICTCVCILYLIFFIIYHNKKISKADNSADKKLQNTNNLLTNNTSLPKGNERIEHEKYDQLFKEISNYFESKSPFRDSDFNIQQLASELNSNSTYISRAINLNTNMNFKTFVNTHRITQIKKELNDNDNNKYTLMYIYTNAGFKYQSTFNKVFKQIENITPSEYIAKENIRKNQ